MNTDLEPISLKESKLLIDCEATIKKGQETFFEVGQAIVKIRDGKLYRSEHRSFEDYCRERWGWEKRYVQYVVSASNAVAALPEAQRTIVRSESQARELARIPADKRAEVLGKAGDKPTAKAIRQAAKVTLEEASEPTSRPEPEQPAALKGINLGKVDKLPEEPAVKMSDAAAAWIDAFETSCADGNFLVGELKSGSQIDCTQFKEIRAQANRMMRLMDKLEAEICG